MRPLALALLLAALLCLPLAPARADDQAVDRLEQRVAMLLDLVGQLRSEVAQLKARILHLELRLAGKEPSELVVDDETTVEEVIEEVLTDASLTGTYVLDREASVEAVLARQVDVFEDEAEGRRMIQGELAGVEMTLEMKDDGTFAVELTGLDGDTMHTAAGTWSRDGETLKLVTTHEDGKANEKGEGDEIDGTWKDGKIHLTQGGDDFVLIFKKKP